MAVCLHCGLAPTDVGWGDCPYCSRPVPARRTGGWPILAVVGVVVVLGAVVVFFLLHNKIPGTAVAGPITTATTTVTTTTTPETTSATPTSSTTAAAGPETVVQNYYKAINNHDYQAAWDLGGKNLSPSFDEFSKGFAGTANDQVTVTAVTGNTVQVQLAAQQADGTVRNFAGSYTVDGGVITAASLKASQ